MTAHLPLTELDYYRLESRIGAGGTGEVYRARDTRLQREVAIKLWRRSEHGSGESGRRMLREARAASALNHPNIVTIHAFGETADGAPYIVQEFVVGRTLRELLDARLPLDQVVTIAGQVARALAAAHAAGIVHRDVKPENVIVRPDGLVKVLDFGIAHLPPAVAESGGATMETLSHDLIGTPAYMSPELLLGGALGPPADVFALGVLLYELLTGQQPFAAPTAMAVLTRIAMDEPVPPARVDPAVSAGLDALVLSMLDKVPERRPTAAEVERALPALARPTEPEASGAGPRALTVGREAPLAQLAQLYARARAGRSAVVGVSGEPGIGKSTLLEAFMADLRSADDPPVVVRVSCSETLAGSEAYLPVLDALDAFRTRGRASLDALMRSVAPTWHAQLGTTVPGADEGGGAAASQERLKRELRAFLADASRRAPIVWIIEDLHWADASTIDLLNYLAARFEDMRVLVVAAFRPSDLTLARHPFLAVRDALQARGTYVEIALRLFTHADVAGYLALLWPTHRFPDGLVDALHARTEGSPLFLADLVRYLHDTGTIVEVDGVWTIVGSPAEATRELPASVRGMIVRRIERVDDLGRRLLAAASVQGQEFDALAVGEALELDAAEVEERLAMLEAVHGLVQRGAEVEYPDGALTLRLRFVHVLYQNVLYEQLPPSRRVTLCGRTARALAAHHGADGAAAGRIAVLFEAAREFALAGQYFYAATERAVGLLGFREALTLAERGLDGVRRLPDAPARWQLELGLQMMRAHALRLVRGWATPELEPTLARARQLCQQLDDPPELLPVLWNLTFFDLIRGNLAQVQEEQRALTAQAAAASEPAFLMAARHVAGVTCEFMGDVQQSSELLEHARALHDPARHREYTAMFGADPGMYARAMSSRPLWALGYPDRALARSRETIALGESQRQPVTLTFALLVSQGIHVFRGEAADAIVLGDRIDALCAEYEFPQEREWARGFRAGAFVVAGALERGIAELTACLATLAELRSGLVRTMFLSLLADAHWRAGQFDAGMAVLDEGFAHAGHTMERGFLHELHRVRGELLALAGRPAEAEAHLREAVGHARRHAARGFELRAVIGLARLLGATGRVAEGRAELAPLLDWFTEGAGTADHVAARALLANLQG